MEMSSRRGPDAGVDNHGGMRDERRDESHTMPEGPGVKTSGPPICTDGHTALSQRAFDRLARRA